MRSPDGQDFWSRGRYLEISRPDRLVFSSSIGDAGSPKFTAHTTVTFGDHGDTPEREALWRDVQARTAALSPKGRLEVVEGSGHFIQADRSEAVIAAVLEVARAIGADTSSCETAIPVR